MSEGRGTMVTMLTERHNDILTFESNHPEASGGLKNSLAREAFGHRTLAGYYQELYAIVLLPDALAEHTLTVKRVLRQKEERANNRAARRLGQF